VVLRHFVRRTQVDKEISDIITKLPLLAELSVDNAMFMRNVVKHTLSENWSIALDEVLLLLESEVPDVHENSFLTLAQNLAAAADNSQIYVYLKKVWISYLLDCLRLDEAATELDELLQILPSDEDFIALQDRYCELANLRTCT